MDALRAAFPAAVARAPRDRLRAALAPLIAAAPLALAATAPASPPSEARDWTLPPRGRGVTLTLAEGRTIEGVSLGLRDGAAWVGVVGGEVGVALEEVVAAAAAATGEASYRARRGGGRSRRGDGPHAVPLWNGPLAPSFHQGYFDRRVPLAR